MKATPKKYQLFYNQPTLEGKKLVQGVTWYAKRAPGDGGVDWEYTKDPAQAGAFGSRLKAAWKRLHGTRACHTEV